jgi:hypothetical protein
MNPGETSWLLGGGDDTVCDDHGPRALLMDLINLLHSSPTPPLASVLTRTCHILHAYFAGISASATNCRTVPPEQISLMRRDPKEQVPSSGAPSVGRPHPPRPPSSHLYPPAPWRQSKSRGCVGSGLPTKVGTEGARHNSGCQLGPSICGGLMMDSIYVRSLGCGIFALYHQQTFGRLQTGRRQRHVLHLGGEEETSLVERLLFYGRRRSHRGRAGPLDRVSWHRDRVLRTGRVLALAA